MTRNCGALTLKIDATLAKDLMAQSDTFHLGKYINSSDSSCTILIDPKIAYKRQIVLLNYLYSFLGTIIFYAEIATIVVILPKIVQKSQSQQYVTCAVLLGMFQMNAIRPNV